jgi:hypothetical protein
MIESVQIVSGLKNAMPDLKFVIEQATVTGNQATGKAQWAEHSPVP